MKKFDNQTKHIIGEREYEINVNERNGVYSLALFVEDTPVMETPLDPDDQDGSFAEFLSKVNRLAAASKPFPANNDQAVANRLAKIQKTGNSFKEMP